MEVSEGGEKMKGMDGRGDGAEREDSEGKGRDWQLSEEGKVEFRSVTEGSTYRGGEGGKRR